MRGKPYQIVYVMAHHESGCAWLVIKQTYDPMMYELDIDYEQGIPEGWRKERWENGNNRELGR